MDGSLGAVQIAEISTEEVRRRFRWARRQGRPAWLWPEVAIAEWRGAMGAIQDAIRCALDASGEIPPLDGDPITFGLAGYTSGTGPLLGHWIDQGIVGASAPIAAVFERHLVQNRVRAARLSCVALRLAEALAGRGVDAVVLKGAHTAHVYFPEPGTRPASDIDLLVRPADLAIAEEALVACGLALQARRAWESEWRDPSRPRSPRSLWHVHADDPWTVDLHTSLNVTAGGGAPVADLDAAGPMASRTRWPIGSRAAALDEPLQLLYLAAHAGAGWQNLTLLRLVELILVIRSDTASGQLSWDQFLSTGERTRALGYAFPALSLCEQLVPRTVPPPVLQRCSAHAPRAVRRMLEGLSPATAQRIDRSSLTEHFMWASGWAGKGRQLVSDLVPQVGSWPQVLRIYEERAWRLIRGTLSH